MNLFRKINLLLFALFLRAKSRSRYNLYNYDVIVKTDAIGDYILFRNSLESYKKNSSNKIILVGNSAWKDIALYLDSKVIDQFIWIDFKKISNDQKYFKRILFRISAIRYNNLLSPSISRDFLSSLILLSANALVKYCYYADGMNANKIVLRISEYGCFAIKSKHKYLFEFFRNIEFFSYVLGTKDQPTPDLSIELHPSSSTLEKFKLNENQYCIFFVGGSAQFRKWDINNYIETAKNFNKNCKILFCGSRDDLISTATNLPDNCIDLTGKTSLIEMLYLIQGSYFILSNETSIPHMAAALNKKIMVISNGNHYGRFSPYPSSLNKEYYTIYPDELMSLSIRNRLSRFYTNSTLNINSISARSATSLLNFIVNNDHSEKNV